MGTTTIYVTHDQSEAMGLGDRIAVLDHGKVRQIGAPGRGVRQSGRHVRGHLHRLPADEPDQPRRDLIGLRPEHMLPAQDLRGEFAPIDFAVDRIEYLSGDRHVYGTVLNLGEDTQVIARLPSTITTPLVPGSVAKFGIGVDRLRYFDKDTGLRRAAAPVGAVGV